MKTFSTYFLQAIKTMASKPLPLNNRGPAFDGALSFYVVVGDVAGDICIILHTGV